MPTAEQARLRWETVSSRENRWLRLFRAALRRGPEAAEGMIGLEGPHLVEEAFRSGLEVTAVLASPAGLDHVERLQQYLEPETRLLRTSDRAFAGVAGTRTPQGIAALARPHTWGFDDLVRGDVPLVVVLVGVQDPGNVGTIVRSAEAFGATGIAACRGGEQGTAHPLSPKALRASAGSALRMPAVAGMAAAVVMAQLRVAGVKLYAASLGEGVEPRQADLCAPHALLIGSEGAGLPAEVERSAELRIRIPLGRVESLNAGVAASLLLYEAARQRSHQESR